MSNISSAEWHEAFQPVDPFSLSLPDIQERARVLMEMEAAGGTTPPGRAGWFICWLCRREFEKMWSDAEAAEEFARRFPDEKLDVKRDVMTCNACNFIISWVTGTGSGLG